jgi:hypothetical protein
VVVVVVSLGELIVERIRVHVRLKLVHDGCLKLGWYLDGLSQPAPDIRIDLLHKRVELIEVLLAHGRQVLGCKRAEYDVVLLHASIVGLMQ